MKKKILVAAVLLFTAAVTFAYPPRINIDEVQNAIQDVINNVKAKYGIAESDALNPDELTYEELATIGKAVFDAIEKQHEELDIEPRNDRRNDMMGEEGSQQRKLFYINMGFRYLASEDGMMFGRKGRGHGRHGGNGRGW